MNDGRRVRIKHRAVPALGWLNGSQLLAMAVLFLSANRLQMRRSPQ
jgi:hypothetical protein